MAQSLKQQRIAEEVRTIWPVLRILGRPPAEWPQEWNPSDLDRLQGGIRRLSKMLDENWKGR